MSTAVADPTQSALPGTLILTMFENSARNLTLRSLELLGQGCRMRISFTRDNALSTVINQDLKSDVDTILSKAPEGNGLISLPDFVLRAPGLVLSSVRLITAPNPTGGRYFSMRFERVFGNLMNFFNASVDVANALQMQARSLADLALNNVYLPLFDFAEFLETANDANLYGDRKRLYRHLSETRDRIRELEVYHQALAQMIDEDKSRESLQSWDQPPPGTRLS